MKNLIALGVGFIYCFGGFDHVYCMNNDKKTSDQQTRERVVTFTEPKWGILNRQGREQAKTLTSAILEDNLSEVEQILETVEREGTHKTALSHINLKEAGDVNILTATMLTAEEHSFEIFRRILDCVLATHNDRVLINALTAKCNTRYKEELGLTPLSLCIGYECDYPQYFPLIIDAIKGKSYVMKRVLKARMSGFPLLSTAISVGATEKAIILLDLIKEDPKLLQYVLRSVVKVRYGLFLGYTPLMIAIARKNKSIIDCISRLIIKNGINPNKVLFINNMEKKEKAYAEAWQRIYFPKRKIEKKCPMALNHENNE